MRIYVAGKFEEVEAVRKIQKLLVDAGHTITHDWTRENPGSRTGQELEDFLNDCAYNDFLGVNQAQAVVLLNHDRAFGAMVEFGLALGWAIPIFILGVEIRDNIFFHLGEGFDIYAVSGPEALLAGLNKYNSSVQF